MNKRQSNEMQSIRKKLLAAIAMLLIACIMTVSSTYAWFTLSTAPEVKGITTTVGANGNLEIALGTYDTVYGDLDPTSSEGDSMDKDGKDKHAANITWGNLIDLSPASYGLGAITLYPTRLNATATGLNTASPLAFPLYGTDGRIVELKDDATLVGIYNSTTGGFSSPADAKIGGVNGIGSPSDMTDREFAVRNNRLAIETYRLAAANEAKGALALYSGDLAALALQNQDSGEDVSVSAEDVATLKALIAKLEKSNEAIGNSLKSAVLLGIAGVEDMNDILWANAAKEIEKKNITETIAYIKTLAEVSGNANITSIADTYVKKYDDIAAALTAAKAELPTENIASTWGDVKKAVSALLKAGDIKICEYTISEIQASKNGADKTVFEDVLSKALGTGLEFQFGPESGIFANIAELVGAYNSSITFPEGVEVEGIPLSLLGNRPVTVESLSTNDAGDLGTIKGLMAGVNAPAAGGNTDKALTDTYGYSVDLLFRTNATDSYLNLQTAAANRIYAENGNAALMGGGSNMTFTLAGEYTAEKINRLAEGIRVVFYDTASTNHEILGVAMLDTASGQATAGEYKLNLNLVDYSIGADGKMDVSKGFITTDDANTAKDERVALTALAANSVKKVTALVYLDGDVIDNADVGSAANLNGKLNLQFSSSASLVPMDNNALMNTTPATT